MSLRLLIVDGSKVSRHSVRDLLSSLLAHRDFTIDEAERGRVALDRCTKESFDLVVTNLTMPGMTGYELLLGLRQSGVKSKVIVVSADVPFGAAERALRLGAMAFLRKPIDREALDTILTEKHFL